MKKHYVSTYVLTATVAIGTLVSSCSKSEKSPGYEYMPDMYRSPAVEAYVDYNVDGDPFSDRNDRLSARQPVEGTVPFSADADKAWMNYPYPFSKEQYDESAAYWKENPVELTEANFNAGKEIFTKFCQHCHGAEGQGDGAIVTNGNYPPIPAYGNISGLNIGKMFHTLTYGKGNMGSHASQLTKEERWKVIHYVSAMKEGTTKYEEYAPMVAAAPQPAATDSVPAAEPK